MSFKPLTEEEFKKRTYKCPKCTVMSDVADFLSSGAQYGQIDCDGYAHTSSCATTYINAIRRMNLKDQVRVITRGGDVFLEKMVVVRREA